LALPFGRPPGYPALYWQVRRESYGVLDNLVSEVGPRARAGVAVDLGAGNGWLSYRLAERGYRVIAMDVNVEAPFGLAGATPYLEADYTILPVQGDLERPPLQAGRTSLLLFNASLHYCDNLGDTLRRGAEALRPGGTMIIVDTPISRRGVPGSGRGDRHLGREELDQGLRAAGLRPSWHRVGRGPAWWVHQAKSRLRREALFWFPIVVAIKDMVGEG
jgi:SAM-dependent methyltransferase